MKSKLLGLIVAALTCGIFMCSFVSNALAACDWECGHTVWVQCPTWREPLRQCPKTINDPICESNKKLCRGKVHACVVAVLVSYNATPACVACVYGAVVTGGAISAACIAICGIAAASLEQTVQQCK